MLSVLRAFLIINIIVGIGRFYSTSEQDMREILGDCFYMIKTDNNEMKKIFKKATKRQGAMFFI